MNTDGWPSVTRILKAAGLGPDFRHVDPATLDRARRKGRALHAAIALDARGALDEGTLHPEIAGGLAAYRRFLAETGFVPQDCEIELADPDWQVVGHVDAVGRMNGDDGLVMVDWKSRAVDLWAVRYQLAGYARLWRVAGADEPISRYLAVALKADGTYTAHSVDPTPHEQTFLAAVLIFRALAEKGDRT